MKNKKERLERLEKQINEADNIEPLVFIEEFIKIARTHIKAHNDNKASWETILGKLKLYKKKIVSNQIKGAYIEVVQNVYKEFTESELRLIAEQ